jgi:hypothetical protein
VSLSVCEFMIHRAAYAAKQHHKVHTKMLPSELYTEEECEDEKYAFHELSQSHHPESCVASFIFSGISDNFLWFWVT